MPARANTPANVWLVKNGEPLTPLTPDIPPPQYRCEAPGATSTPIPVATAPVTAATTADR